MMAMLPDKRRPHAIRHLTGIDLEMTLIKTGSSTSTAISLHVKHPFMVLVRHELDNKPWVRTYSYYIPSLQYSDPSAG